jgi:zinc transport system substrate-binding protein
MRHCNVTRLSITHIIPPMRLLLLLLCLQSFAAFATPRVVTSIPPLADLTSVIMAGVGEPQTIIGENASAHHFALRPSHMRLLQQADLVIWIDRGFEAGFARIVETLPASVSQLELLPALGIDHGDGHIWYSPRRLQQAIEVIQARLGEIDPPNRERYRDNARRLSQQIDNWRTATRSRLAASPPRYITDHAFSAHFGSDLGFAALASVHDQHDEHGSLGDLDEIEARLRAQPAVCLLTLESRPSPLALELARKFDLEVISLAAGGSADSASGFQRLQRLATALADCAG